MVEKHIVFRIPGLRDPLYLPRQHNQIPECVYLGDNERTYMWFPSFAFTIDNIFDNVVNYESLGRL